MGGASAWLVGVSKTGAPGLGTLVVPLMILSVGDARQSAGWLLPMLCTADLFAVWYWRRHAAAAKLFGLAPWVVAGIGAGAAALSLQERILRPAEGVIVAAMLLAYLWRRRTQVFEAKGHSAAYGLTAGFATTVANAAGPVMSVYLLRQRLPKEEFVATGAWFFFLVNLAKVPIYAWHGLFSARSLAFNLLAVPVVAAGALSGRWLLTRISPRWFENLVLLLTAISTLLLFR